MAVAFFAALAVALGHMVYEFRADPLIKRLGRREFQSEAMHGFAPGALDENKRLDEAIHHIRALAASRPHSYHSNFVERNDQLVFVPTPADKCAEDILPDRKFIIVEEGARCAHQLAGYRHLGSAFAALALYGVAVYLIAVLVVGQAYVVSREAGLLSSLR